MRRLIRGFVLLCGAALLVATLCLSAPASYAGERPARSLPQSGAARRNGSGPPLTMPQPTVQPSPSPEPTPAPTGMPLTPEDRVYSHRGASGEETEHTLAAYDLAVLCGSRYLEQDVVLSADDTLYVSHDPSALRLTGQDLLFADLHDEEIDRLRTAQGQSILKLSDVFERYGEKVHYVVELRQTEEVEPFLRLVEDFGFADRVIVQSFQRRVLEAVQARRPEMVRLYLLDDPRRFESALALSYVDILCVEKGMMTRQNCDSAHLSGKRFSVWTLDTEEEITQAIRLGVDCYFTDYTARALALEQELRGG